MTIVEFARLIARTQYMAVYGKTFHLDADIVASFGDSDFFVSPVREVTER